MTQGVVAHKSISISPQTNFSAWLPSLDQPPIDYHTLWDAINLLQSFFTTNLNSSSSPHPDTDQHQDQDQDQYQCIDPWEKNFATTWLTRVMAYSFRLASAHSSRDSANNWETLAALAGGMVALLTGNPATTTQPFTRRFAFEVHLPHHPTSAASGPSIEVILREDTMSYAAIGCQTWNSALLLCRRIAAFPLHFFPQFSLTHPNGLHDAPQPPEPSSNTPPATISCTPLNASSRRSLKVLELGAGTGLVGITTAGVLAHLLQTITIDSPYDIELVLTDYHSKVLANLQHNLKAHAKLYSLSPDCESTLSVRVEELDWRMLQGSTLARTGYQTTFDVILGSDLVYEPQHAMWVANAVRCFLKPKPQFPNQTSGSSQPARPGCQTVMQPTFHLLLPLRPTFARESQAVHLAFGGHTLSQLLSPVDFGSLPTHNCEWEEDQSPTHLREPIVPGFLTIQEYANEEGVQFGQGCGSYQYLRISHL